MTLYISLKGPRYYTILHIPLKDPRVSIFFSIIPIEPQSMDKGSGASNKDGMNTSKGYIRVTLGFRVLGFEVILGKWKKGNPRPR